MKIRIQHRTTYSYNSPVSFGQHRMMTRPREGHDLHIESSILQITPGHTIHWMRDVNGNSIAKIDFTERADKLMLYSELVLSHYDSNPLDFILEEHAVYYPFVYDPSSQPELAPFIQTLFPRDTGTLRAWLEQFWQPGEKVETLALLQRLNSHIHARFLYTRRDAHGVQTPAETLQKNSGSCRDFATLFLEACRCWGLAARFVSGYMLCEATEAGGGSTHAWTEVYLPGAGWKGFDSTSGIVTGSQHVTVAVSRDPEMASPIMGSFVGPTTAFYRIEVDVTVVQLDRMPLPPLSNSIQHQASREENSVQQQVEQVPQQDPSPAPVMEMVIPPALAENGIH